MFKEILILAVLILTFAGNADALGYCTNSSWMVTETNNSGDIYKQCDNSCLNGECVDMERESLSIVIGLILIAFFFTFTGLKLDKDTHGVIQVLFLFVGMMFVIIALAVISELAAYSGINAIETATNAGYNLSIYVFWFVLFWFIILLFYKLLVGMGKIQPIQWNL